MNCFFRLFSGRSFLESCTGCSKYAMSFSYKHVGRSSRNHFVEPPPLIERVVNAAPVGLPIELGRPPMMLENFISTCSPQILQTFRSAQKWLASRRIRSLPNVLIILWLILLYWGEILVFRQSVAACHWSNWEQWVRRTATET